METTTPATTPSATPDASGKKFIAYDEAALAGSIGGLKAGEVARVEVPAGKVIKSDVFAKAKETGALLELASADGKVVWNFKKVTGEMKDFYVDGKIGVELADVSKALSETTLPKTMKYTTVDFTYSGELAGEVEVTLNLSNGGFTEGQTLFFYYFNPNTNRFELMDSAAYKSGNATFKITHCSEYIVTSEKLPTALTTVKTGDSTNVLLFFAIFALGCIMITYAYVMRAEEK